MRIATDKCICCRTRTTDTRTQAHREATAALRRPPRTNPPDMLNTRLPRNNMRPRARNPPPTIRPLRTRHRPTRTPHKHRPTRTVTRHNSTVRRASPRRRASTREVSTGIRAPRRNMHSTDSTGKFQAPRPDSRPPIRSTEAPRVRATTSVRRLSSSMEDTDTSHRRHTAGSREDILPTRLRRLVNMHHNSRTTSMEATPSIRITRVRGGATKIGTTKRSIGMVGEVLLAEVHT